MKNTKDAFSEGIYEAPKDLKFSNFSIHIKNWIDIELTEIGSNVLVKVEGNINVKELIIKYMSKKVNSKLIEEVNLL